MRRLSLRAAARCEEACHPRCRCRCGGALHGARRADQGQGPEFYAELPADDPHYALPKKVKTNAA